MTLSSGTRLGPYEIVAPLGAGGMGEVYRARDERLKRDVAIKVLPATLSTDTDRLRRFEQEAQAAGGLNHPNITAVYDLGSRDGSPYIVTELLEGETLRARLSGGPLAVRKATDYAIQIARGLAAAHEKGIVHRDLKPENLFVTNDGRVKILDFGLAKLTEERERREQTDLPTAGAATEPGVVLGTLGYMSPEQVKGKPADARSDIFAFGAILYEMLSGRRAFHRDSAAETMSAILREEPPDLSATNRTVHPGLERVVRHCLEKNPEERFHSAHDLAFDLEAISGTSGPSTASQALPGPRKRPSWALFASAVAAAALVAASAATLVTRRLTDSPAPSFRQLTFRRGQIQSARFGPDGQTVVYSAAWDGKPMEIFVGRPESPESRAFGLAGAEVLSVSRSGDMAVSLNRAISGPFRRTGTLAQLSVAGGAAPREILKDIEWADWAPDGRSLAVVRTVPGRMRLEYPVGKVLYETSAWIGHPKVSPDGQLVAFIDHPTPGDDGGSVLTVDRSGGLKKLTAPFATVQGLAWSRDGSEIWFTAAEVGGNRGLYSVTLSGRVRSRVRVPGSLMIQDVSRDGRLLVTRDNVRSELVGKAVGESRERELTWLDWSLPAVVSPDGKIVLFSESGEGGGAGYSVYIRNLDGSPAVRLGEGNAQDLSPDGQWALAIIHSASDPQLVAYPTGAGEPRVFAKEGLSTYAASFLPDGKQMVITASEAGHGQRIYVRDFAGGKPRALTPEGYSSENIVAPDGKWVVVTGPDRRRYLYSTSGGEPTPIAGLDSDDRLDQRDASGRFLYGHRRGELPSRVFRIDLTTQRREIWRTLMPGDGAGVANLLPLPTPSGDAYVYNYIRTLSDLYLVDGLQ
jgi:eukaryotic-like serine/threonine-protein kinase